MTPLTLIIPVYNGGDYFRECLQSAVAELWEGCRIILVDDGSTDGSERMCLDYAMRYPRVVSTFRTAHVGQATARNRALDLIETPFVAFCDADDYYYPGALAAMAAVLDSEPDCDMVMGRFSHSEVPPRRMPGPRFYDPGEILIKTLYQKSGFHNSLWGCVYRSSIFESVRLAGGRYYEDLEAFPRICLAARRIAYIPSPVYYYRPNPGSFINTWTPSRADALFATRSIEEYVAEYCPAALGAARSRRFSAACNICLLARKHGQRELAAECRSIIRRLRRSILADPHVRLKNKIAAIISCLQR